MATVQDGDRIKPCNRESILNEIAIHRMVSRTTLLVGYKVSKNSPLYFYLVLQLVTGGEIFDKYLFKCQYLVRI